MCLCVRVCVWLCGERPLRSLLLHTPLQPTNTVDSSKWFLSRRTKYRTSSPNLTCIHTHRDTSMRPIYLILTFHMHDPCICMKYQWEYHHPDGRPFYDELTIKLYSFNGLSTTRSHVIWQRPHTKFHAILHTHTHTDALFWTLPSNERAHARSNIVFVCKYKHQRIQFKYTFSHSSGDAHCVFFLDFSR